MSEHTYAMLAVLWALCIGAIWACFPVVRHGPQDEPEDDPELIRTYTTHPKQDANGATKWFVFFHGFEAVDEPFGPYDTEDEATEAGAAGCY